MAGGKENARQKMINLMYLVFIAMLALNMSKEVLMTFGEIEREVTKSSKSLISSNKAALSVMQSSAKNDSIVWYAPYETVSKIAAATDELVEFINKKSNELVPVSEANPDQIFKRPIKIKENDYGRTINGVIPETVGDYERMDNSQGYDELLFMSGTEDGYTDAGREFVRLVNNFREVAIEAIDNSNIGSNDTIIKKRWNESTTALKNLVESSFNTDPVKVGKGEDKVKSWLHFNFEGFPEIASTTKMTLLEEDALNVVKTLVSNVNEIILGENLSSLRAIPMNVNVFYENSKLEGTVALGKYDETFIASKVKIQNGNGPMREYRAIDVMENGEVVLEKLDLNVGAAGAKKLTGEIIFIRTENGEDVEKSIPIDHEYFVNPPLANVSNKDMNIVYEDIENILNITMPGVSNDNIQIISPNTIKPGKNGEFIMTNQKKGRTGKVSIVVKDKLTDFTSPPVVFDVVAVPDPFAAFSQKGDKFSANEILTGKISGTFNNERLDNSLRLVPSEFKVRIGLRNMGVVRNTNGAFNDRLKSEIKKARRGTQITISEIVFSSTKIDKGRKSLFAQNQIVLTVR